LAGAKKLWLISTLTPGRWESWHRDGFKMFQAIKCSTPAKIEILNIFKTQEVTYGKPHQGQQRSTKVKVDCESRSCPVCHGLGEQGHGAQNVHNGGLG
jgi:hypothetical protein